ncbi:MAG TPA: amino acid adenylation domain-containing protein, partial [Burkholderiaceae bacterium]|nr:amino acid adenylation domain-containing protein [Burkholderiaceae bacterium]
MQSLLSSVFETHANRAAVQGASIAWTYAELDRLSAGLAQALAERGVAPGQAVPILMGRSPLLVLSQLALLRLGGSYAPIDMASPAPRRRAMLDALGSALALTDGADAAEAAGSAEVFDVAAWLSGQRSGRAVRDPWVEPPPGTPACVMFTSGSTGVPKGVMVPHAGIARLVHGANYAHFGPEQRWAQLSSPAFDASTLEVWGALLNGGCCMIQEEAVPSLETLGEFLIAQRITDAWLTSALFNAMVEDQLAALGQLRQLLVGGERVSARHARLMLQAHPNVRLINGYGPTENTTFTLCHTITPDDTEGATGVPIGTPVAGTQVRVEPSDPDVPEKGELWAAGDGVAFGYLGDAALTQAKFVWHGGARWYRTGDLVRRRSDGVFEFHGRIDRQIKLRGQRIELEEVELALAACPGVGNSAVLVVGQNADDRRLIAFYDGPEAADPSDAQVAAHMRLTLPDAAIPSQFVRLQRLPANLSGKVDRKALEAMWVGGPASLVDRLQQVIALNPDRPALEGRHETLSYAELDQRSARLAAQLIALGLAPGDHVALLLPRSVALVVAMLAVLRAGAVYAPLDPGHPPQRTSRVLDLLKPKFTLTDGAAPGIAFGDCRCIDLAEPATLAAARGAAPWAVTPPDAPLYVMFTSGSTGVPKGVIVPGRGVLALVADAGAFGWAAFPPEARWLLVTSPSFDISNLEIWGALLNGACCVIQEGELPSLDELARLITARRVTHAQLSTALFNAMVDTQLGALLGLTQLITGGERASPPHMRKLLLARPGLRLINAYGPTETTIWSLSHRVDVADTHAAAGIPIGRPVRGTRLRLEPLPIDAAEPTGSAELLIAGAGVALGYLHDAQQTRRSFVELDGERWYRTGDLVSQRADGTLAFHGRADRQVKLQGQRIELDEVELALASCPGVGEVAVLLHGDDAAHRHLVAFYAGLAGATPDAEQVTAHAAAQLPLAAVPTVVRALDQLPQNRNGKVDRAALARLAEAADVPGAQDADAAAAPIGEFETRLAAIWQTLLPRARIGRGSHFLRSGGSSLLALHVATQVHKQLGRNLAPVDVLRRPVLAEQAALISQLPQLGAEAAVYDPSGGHRVPMTHLQQSLLAASAIDLTDCAYLVHVGLVLPEAPPDWLAWRAAFAALAQRHPALRLSAFHDGEIARGTLEESLAPGWWQEHAPIAELPRDLDWPEAVQAAINRPLDTHTQGSMRVDCWRVHGGGAAVVWTVHHHALDEASIGNALTELDALLRGAPLAPVYGSPFSFQAVESAWADRPAAMGQWAARLAETLEGCTPPLERAPALGHERRFELGVDLRHALKARCAVLGCTPFTLLLTAYGLALQEAFGPRFRFVSTPFSRRAEPELLEPIGYLLDVRFVEAGALPGEAPDATLARVHRAILDGQEPSFQWLDTLIEAVEAINPQAARCLSQFGFTWRLDPARVVSMGGQTAQLLRVPQRGARLSMFLHAAQLGDTLGYSIEAVASAHRSGQVEAVAGAFERHLAALCASPRDATLLARPAPATTAGAVLAAVDTALDATLTAAWARWLKLPEATVTASSHFLRSGGSSLVAMRLAAELRREHGIKLDVGAFLGNATFAQLTALSRAKP